jgi:hypothetical protein
LISPQQLLDRQLALRFQRIHLVGVAMLFCGDLSLKRALVVLQVHKEVASFLFNYVPPTVENFALKRTTLSFSTVRMLTGKTAL